MAAPPPGMCDGFKYTDNENSPFPFITLPAVTNLVIEGYFNNTLGLLDCLDLPNLGALDFEFGITDESAAVQTFGCRFQFPNLYKIRFYSYSFENRLIEEACTHFPRVFQRCDNLKQLHVIKSSFYPLFVLRKYYLTPSSGPRLLCPRLAHIHFTKFPWDEHNYAGYLLETLLRGRFDASAPVIPIQTVTFHESVDEADMLEYVMAEYNSLFGSLLIAMGPNFSRGDVNMHDAEAMSIWLYFLVASPQLCKSLVLDSYAYSLRLFKHDLKHRWVF